jgi:hypothetical protein
LIYLGIIIQLILINTVAEKSNKLLQIHEVFIIRSKSHRHRQGTVTGIWIDFKKKKRGRAYPQT